MMLQYILTVFFTSIPYYLGVGLVLAIFNSLFLYSLRENKLELGEITLIVFLYPFIIHSLIINKIK